MIVAHHYVITSCEGWLYRYAAWEEADWPAEMPGRSIVGIYITRRGARRAIARHRRSEAKQAAKSKDYRERHPVVETL